MMENDGKNHGTIYRKYGEKMVTNIYQLINIQKAIENG